jgi:hypothetical protein
MLEIEANPAAIIDRYRDVIARMEAADDEPGRANGRESPIACAPVGRNGKATTVCTRWRLASRFDAS